VNGGGNIRGFIIKRVEKWEMNLAGSEEGPLREHWLEVWNSNELLNGWKPCGEKPSQTKRCYFKCYGLWRKKYRSLKPYPLRKTHAVSEGEIEIDPFSGDTIHRRKKIIYLLEIEESLRRSRSGNANLLTILITPPRRGEKMKRFSFVGRTK
jgi:hypothetical protein